MDCVRRCVPVTQNKNGNYASYGADIDVTGSYEGKEKRQYTF